MATALNFLRANIKWQFNQQPFSSLIYPSATQSELCKTLEMLAEKYYPQAQAVDLLQTEFALNRVALSRANTDEQKLAKKYFYAQWLTFCRLKRVFGGAGMFPSNGDGVRIMQIAQTIAKCTQFCISNEQTNELLEFVLQTFDLTEREQRHLRHAIELCKLQHYAAAYFANGNIAKTLCPSLLGTLPPNDRYRQATYATAKITACVNCLGNAAVQVGEATFPDKAVLLYAEGKNALDTFCNSKLGEHTASFLSETRSTRLAMQLFLSGNSLVRRYDLTNKSARNRNFTVEIPFKCPPQDFFELQNASCACIKNVYAAVALVINNKIMPLSRSSDFGSLNAQILLKKGESAHFDIVTTYSANIADINHCLAQLQRYGATRCPYAADLPHSHVMQGVTLKLTPQSNQKRYGLAQPNKASYVHRLGDCNVATLVDNVGNNTTLLRGFPFTSEYIFSVKHGQMTPLNIDAPTVNGQAVTFENGISRCTIRHENGAKIVSISCNANMQHCVLLTLAQKSKISLDGTRFTVDDGLRKYHVNCSVAPQSVTTNALECNVNRLRYKLSSDMQAQTCIAFCTPKVTDFSVQITSADTVPQPTPLLKESLLSAYLSYVNEKTTFCYRNRLTRTDSLSLAAICYTNPQFVYKYLTENYHNGTFTEYYYSDSILQKAQNPLLLALGGVYYMRLRSTNGADESTNQPALPDQMLADIQRILFAEFSGRELCIKALALKRACGVATFDNARCATEYARIKKIICADNKLYAYAQAIGAVPMVNTSKERLKDLCNGFGIPKGWYYVSQLENLYGMNYHNGQLSFNPKIHGDSLERLALELDGKRIDASFFSGSSQGMTLNGVTHFLPFCPASLKQQVNTLEIRC